jgi:hypothetical protein
MSMKTIIVLAGGQTVQTRDNAPSDIAGLVNAGTPKIYACTDALDPAKTHNVVTSYIMDVYAEAERTDA